MLAKKVITGVALPSGSDKLYSSSKDQSVLAWDCHTGQCAAVVSLGDEIGCMMSEGPWLFVGIPNSVKVWNTQTASEFSFSGPVGQVHSLVEGNGLLFAGTQDGKILAWKIDATRNCFQPSASLEGHSLPVVSLVVGADRLYSGSMDHTIRVWDLETLQYSVRGRTFSKEVHIIQIAPDGLGLFFTGDGTGELKVWKWAAEPPKQPE